MSRCVIGWCLVLGSSLNGLGQEAPTAVEPAEDARLPARTHGDSGRTYTVYVEQMPGETWDERIGRLVHGCREKRVDPRTSTGLADLPYYGAAYKYPVALWGPLSDWIATGSAVASNGSASQIR